ncbi:hypothetical protein DOTSEDRAFT_179990 [Dothistroma septosporum NZE10]|uniref:Uncharacterized protein n=1 Tax=Dothistroma septosporum (strain NZE10 / CBS 128990) TaxID=675120 RepID=M2WKE7_DOTSN|nr:hypothetical protein DOTSEDRAFT_179990 [Dothistroma septosporum NZE10]
MDHTNQLIYRNAELQVELRLVKEQLDRAHKSTTYLLDRMRGAEPRLLNTELQRLQIERDQVLRENAHLKSTLKLTREERLPAPRLTDSKASYGVRRIPRSGRDHSPGYTNHQTVGGEACEQGNLLDLEDDSSPSAAASPARTATRERTPYLEDIRHQKAGNTSIGLGISGTSSFDSLETGSSEAHASTAARVSIGRQNGFMTYDSGGNPSFFHTPSPKFPIASRGPRSERIQHAGPAIFADHEHKRLMGAATFIEDMSETDQEEHWAKYGKENPRHSAEEWKAYYHDRIRLAFLARQTAPHSVPATHPLALSIHADPILCDTSPEREHIDPTDQAKQIKPTYKVARALENVTSEIDTKPKNPWSFGTAYDQSLLEARAFLNEATPGGQRPARSSRSRFQALEEDSIVASPTPAFEAIANEVDQGETTLRRDSPPKTSRNSYSRGCYPADPADLFHKPRAEDRNVHRTVLIANIPPIITLAQVLDTVRGGKIFSATYHETAKFRTSPPTTTNTITVVFVNGKHAQKFVEHSLSYPVILEPSLIESSTPAAVSLLPTPTRPIPERLLYQAIPAGLTRVLYVYELSPKLKEPGAVLAKIQQIEPSVPWPLKAGYDEDGVMVLEYASMSEAEMAWMVVNNCPQEFPGVSKGFLGDPCERALEWKGRNAKESEGETQVKGDGVDIVDGQGELGDGEDHNKGERRDDDEVTRGAGVNSAMVRVEREENSKMMEG